MHCPTRFELRHDLFLEIFKSLLENLSVVHKSTYDRIGAIFMYLERTGGNLNNAIMSQCSIP